MMITGTLPALLTFFIRMFVPESQRWRKEESRGATVHWASVDLLGVVLGLAGPALIVYPLGAAHGGTRSVPRWRRKWSGTLIGLADRDRGLLLSVGALSAAAGPVGGRAATLAADAAAAC